MTKLKTAFQIWASVAVFIVVMIWAFRFLEINCDALAEESYTPKSK